MEQNINTTLARHIGIYDGFELELEAYLRERHPVKAQDYAYIIERAKPYRERYIETVGCTGNVNVPYELLFNHLMGDAKIDLLDTLYPTEDIYFLLDKLGYPKERREVALCLVLDSPELKQMMDDDRFPVESGGAYDFEGDEGLEWYQENLKSVVYEVLKLGENGDRFPPIEEEDIEAFQRRKWLERNDLIGYWNMMDGIVVPRIKISNTINSIERQYKLPLTEAPTYTPISYPSEVEEEIPVIDDWAIDRYFAGDPNLKELFGKVREKARAFYKSLDIPDLSQTFFTGVYLGKDEDGEPIYSTGVLDELEKPDFRYEPLY